MQNHQNTKLINVNKKKGWHVAFQFYQKFFKRKDKANTPFSQQHASLWQNRNIRENKNHNHFWNFAFRQQVRCKLPSPPCNFKSSPTRSHTQAANLNNYPFLQNWVCSKANTRAHTWNFQGQFRSVLKNRKNYCYFYSIYNKYDPLHQTTLPWICVVTSLMKSYLIQIQNHPKRVKRQQSIFPICNFLSMYWESVHFGLMAEAANIWSLFWNHSLSNPCLNSKFSD